MCNPIEPLAKVYVRIQCTEPHCREEFSVELKEEELVRCPRCHKEYYVRVGTTIYVKSINGTAPKTSS